MRCVPPPASLTRVKPPPARAPLLITLRARDVTTYLVTNQITPFFCFKSPEWIVTPSIHKPGKRCDNTIRAGGRGTDGRREKKGRDLVRAQVTDREEREGSARFLLLVRSDGVRRRRRRRCVRLSRSPLMPMPTPHPPLPRTDGGDRSNGEPRRRRRRRRRRSAEEEGLRFLLLLLLFQLSPLPNTHRSTQRKRSQESFSVITLGAAPSTLPERTLSARAAAAAALRPPSFPPNWSA